MQLDDAAKFGLRKEVLNQLRKLGIKQFTTVQQAAFESGLCQGKSLVIAAPTSTGKTMIAEIAAIEGAISGIKTIYLVTHKALAEEKYDYFKRNYDSAQGKWFDVSIATGDRNEGDWNNGILVATYEKYLALLSTSDNFSLRGKLVVADEIQILSDSTRGADIEILCAIIRESSPRQIIALSATVPNAKQIAEWLKCSPVKIEYRDIPLRQEIWDDNKRYYSQYGTWEVLEDDNNKIVAGDTLTATKNLLKAGLGPILVFTMTRPKAARLAEEFAESRRQDTKSYKIAEQLELFSEPTDTSGILKIVSEKRVAFHSSDLSFSERSVIENVLRNKELDVVFSTPTLAAGVNFPIKTVLFDSFARTWVAEDHWLPKGEYVNMSGRAGRLGLDEKGYAILMPHNRIERIKANDYISSGMDPLQSVLLNRSMRKSVLHLISIRICKTETEINKFYSNTFWWHQTEERNSKLLEKVAPRISESLEWLNENGLIQRNKSNYNPTQLGKTISSTGLLPSTGIFLFSMIRKNEAAFLDDGFELPLLHAVLCSDEFDEEHGSRFLPFPGRGGPEAAAKEAIDSCSWFVNPLEMKLYDRVMNAAFAVFLWSRGESEATLRETVRPISYGQLHVLALDVAWVLDGLNRISVCSGITSEYSIPAKINLLAQTSRFGVARDALDVFKSASYYQVPGFGRQRAMALARAGLSQPNVLLHSKINSIAKIVQGKDRAEKLIDAVAQYFSTGSDRWKVRHLARSKERDLIALSYEALGHEYEDVIEQIVSQIGWKIKKLDSGKRQGVPDFAVQESGKLILVECKTKQKDDAVISTNDAFDVLTKGADIKTDHNVTIGKPDFDSFSKTKAAGSPHITLVPHHCFIEGYLRWKEGKIKAENLFSWLIAPGVASVENLPEE